MNKNLAILIFLFVSINVFSQYSYYKEAVITKTDNSILNGFVEKISESELNPEINFKVKLQSDPKIIPVTEIKQIIFLSDSSIFQNVIYDYKKDTIKISENRLAKKLVDGYAQLYKLQLPEDEQNIIFERTNTYVYIVMINVSYYVLDQKEKLNKNKYKLEKNYQRMLSYLLKDYDDLRSKVWTLDFTDNQIITIIDKLNKLHPEIKSEVLLKKEKKIILHGPTVGLVLASSENSISGNGFNIGYNISVIYPQLSEKYSIDFGLSWSKLSLKYYDNYNYLRIPVGGTYRFTNNKIAPYFKVGVTFNYFQSSIDPYINAKIGVNILKKIDINTEMDFTPKNELLPINFFYFNIGYLFSNR